MELYHGDCVDVMQTLPDNIIDLTVTSPPYDNLRTYNGYHFNLAGIIKRLYHITKPGGIVVWIVGDAVVDGSETLTSFQHAITFKDFGFNVHDTMVWHKKNFSTPSTTRYHQTFEYMFIFSKGKPKTFNPIKDVQITCNTTFGKNTKRQKDGSMKELPKSFSDGLGMRHNVWNHNTAGQERPGQHLPHPAMFPLQLVKDHVITWSNEGDVILDPMMGSGTTGIAAKELNRQFIGIDISLEYFKLAQQRING